MADSQRKTANLFDESDFGLVEVAAGTYRVGTDVGVLPSGKYTFNAVKSSSAVQIYRTTKNGSTYNYETITNLPYTFTADGVSNQIFRSAGNTGSSWADLGYTNVMLNTGETALSYVPHGWLHSLRKLTTATESVENPLYSDGTAITAYTIKGNTVQNGTPAPSNPVDVNGVGVRTENLFNSSETDWEIGILDDDGNPTGSTTSHYTKNFTVVEPETPYYLSGTIYIGQSSHRIYYYDANKNWISRSPLIVYYDGKFTTPANCKYVRFQVIVDLVSTSDWMLNTGSTAKPYEPYGYKIPISSGGMTTNIYLGSTASIRNVKKAMFSGGDSEGWYLQSINSYGIANFALNSAISPLKWIDTQHLLWVCNRFLPQSSLIADTNTEGIMLNQYNACFVRLNSSTVSTTAAFKTWLGNNPIVVYYVLANAETATVNEPLMKIGDYADTVSNATAIPTTEGANSITVDTTVQPSEFTASWTGWHDAIVKELDGSDWE